MSNKDYKSLLNGETKPNIDDRNTFLSNNNDQQNNNSGEFINSSLLLGFASTVLRHNN